MDKRKYEFISDCLVPEEELSEETLNYVDSWFN